MKQRIRQITKTVNFKVEKQQSTFILQERITTYNQRYMLLPEKKLENIYIRNKYLIKITKLV